MAQQGCHASHHSKPRSVQRVLRLEIDSRLHVDIKPMHCFKLGKRVAEGTCNDIISFPANSHWCRFLCRPVYISKAGNIARQLARVTAAELAELPRIAAGVVADSSS